MSALESDGCTSVDSADAVKYMDTIGQNEFSTITRAQHHEDELQFSMIVQIVFILLHTNS